MISENINSIDLGRGVIAIIVKNRIILARHNHWPDDIISLDYDQLKNLRGHINILLEEVEKNEN